jgi:hypothetical protein
MTGGRLGRDGGLGWAGREAEAQWGGEGKSAGWKKRNGPRLGRKVRRIISK